MSPRRHSRELLAFTYVDLPFAYLLYYIRLIPFLLPTHTNSNQVQPLIAVIYASVI